MKRARDVNRFLFSVKGFAVMLVSFIVHMLREELFGMVISLGREAVGYVG